MKPSFALDLRDDQVVLLHRTSRGWQQVGATRFDAPDLTEALAYMRATALGLSPRGISTKLIIPNDQILYTQVPVTASDAAKRKRQVKAGLDGLTPYPVEDLVYDVHGTGPEVQVAIIARETLDQAEAFASEHRFNPVSFVAVPDNGLFLGEPFFGPSKMSPALLSEGEKVERDSAPVEVVARELPRAPKPKAEEAPPVEDAVPPAVAEALADTAPVPEADDARAEPATGAPPPAEVMAEVPTEPVQRQTLPDFDPPVPERFPAEPVSRPAPQPARVTEVEEAPMAIDVATEDAPAVPPTPAALKQSLAAVPPDDDDMPPAPAEVLRAALAARRAQSQTDAAGLGGAPSLGAAATGPRATTVKPVGAIEPAALKPSLAAAAPKPASAPPKPGKPTTPGKALKGMGAMVTAPAIPGMGRRKVTMAPAPAPTQGAGTAATKPASNPARPMTGLGGKALPARGRPRYLGLILTGVLLVFLALIAAWSSFFMAGLSPDQTGPAATAVSQAAAPASPKDATPPATAETTTAQATGTADPGAAAPTATAAATAAETATAAPDTTQAAASPTATPDATPDPAAAAIAAATALAAPSVTTPAPTAPDTTAASAETTQAAALAAAPAPVVEPAPGTVVSTEAAAAQTQTGGDGAGDQIQLAAVEPATALTNPVALPAAAPNADALPEPAPEPPPYGTVYKFDANGLIVPTPEGILTPEGVLLVAGKPKVVPPDRPAAIAAAAAAPAPFVAPVLSTTVGAAAAPAVAAPAPAAGEIAPTAATPDTTGTATPGAIGLTGPEAAPATDPTATPVAPVQSDPALKSFRPKARPATLVPAALDVPADASPPDPRLAGARPKPRSDVVLASAAAANSASTAGLSGAPSTADEAASDLAVNSSRLPIARPASLSQAVNAAVTAALAQPAAAAAPAPDAQASAAPEAQAEPDVATAAPAIPTSASVAKEATDKNALALSKVALIGVFGADAARYAYVRLPNGTLMKVKVGDALDGGQVVAISASELRYQKSGRLVVLAMPREG